MGNSRSKQNSPVRDDEEKSLVRNSESSELNQTSETDKRVPSSNLPPEEDLSVPSSEEDYEEAEEIEKESEKKFEECNITPDDEKAELLQKISKLESELHAKVSRRDDLQDKHLLLLEHHAQLVSRDIKQQIMISNLKKENEKLRNSSDLEIQVKQLSNQVAMDEQLVMKLETELKDLRLVNERLADQLVSTKERVAADGQEILQQSGELNEKARSSLKLDLQPEQTVGRDISHAVTSIEFLCKSFEQNSGEALLSEKKIIRKIKEQLEKSKTISEFQLYLENELSQEFSAQIRRLASLVKIGQDALMAEQEIVKKLRAEPKETQALPSIEIPPAAEAAQAFENQNINRRNKKRKIQNIYDIDDAEIEEREKMLQTERSSHDAECKELCFKMANRCALNPIKLNLSYGTDLFEKQMVVVIDSNVVISFIDSVSDLLSCKIDDNFPIIYIPYIVVKELDSIRKDNKNMNPFLSRKCNSAMVRLEQLMRQSSRILEQTLKEMKTSSVIEFKNKDADDRITECCLSLKKSENNVLLWTEDLNLRLKVLGHLVPSVKHTEILKIIQHGTKNPLRKRMLKEGNLLLVSEILAQCSAQLILEMLSEPKQAILFLTGNHQNFPSVRESETGEFEEITSRTASLGDLSLDRLFERTE